jgi:hypothetical protein
MFIGNNSSSPQSITSGTGPDDPLSGKLFNGWLTNAIIRFLQFQKGRVSRDEITGSTLRNHVKVLKLFCEMNDLLVPWKKLTRELPKAKNYADDRVPTYDEIQRILEYPDWRLNAIVCTMASSDEQKELDKKSSET